jgi:hypothetical protein
LSAADAHHDALDARIVLGGVERQHDVHHRDLLGGER